MQYSQLCDTSVVAYLAYLAASTSERDGSGTSGSLRIVGGDSVHQGSGGSDGHAGDVVSIFSGLLAEARRGVGDVVFTGATDGVGRYVDRVVGTGSWRGAQSVVGLAAGDDSGRVGSLDSGGCAQSSGDDSGTNVGSASSSSPGRLVRDAVGGEVGGSESSGGGLGKNTLRNRAKRQQRAAIKRERKRVGSVPEWRRTALPSLSGSVRTVDTRTAHEIEAADTLARRRVVENEIAIAKGKHLLTSLADKDKTDALMRLDVARVEERINTTRAKSQASFKKCGSPLESVGSAASAGEFAWKQQVRKQEALQAEVDSLGKQLDKLLTIATPAQFNMLARLELPHIPTDEEIAAMDEDCSPYYTREEAEAEAAAYGVF